MQSAGGCDAPHGQDRADEADCAPGPEGAVAIAAEAKALREANVAFLKRARCVRPRLRCSVQPADGMLNHLGAGPSAGYARR